MRPCRSGKNIHKLSPTVGIKEENNLKIVEVYERDTHKSILRIVGDMGENSIKRLWRFERDVQRSELDLSTVDV